MWQRWQPSQIRKVGAVVYGRKWVLYVACPIRRSLWDTLWELPGNRWEVGTMGMWARVWALWSGWSSSLFSLVFHRTTSAVPSRGLPSQSLQTQSTQHRLAVVRRNVSACHLMRKEVLSTIWCQPRKTRGRKKTDAMLKERSLLLVSEAVSCVHACTCIHAY